MKGYSLSHDQTALDIQLRCWSRVLKILVKGSIEASRCGQVSVAFQRICFRILIQMGYGGKPLKEILKNSILLLFRCLRWPLNF